MNIEEHPIIKTFEGLIAFSQESATDMSECGKALHANPKSMFLRRVCVRTFAAHVEGLIYLMKQVALELHPVMKVDFTVGEVTFLKEKSFELNEKGEVIEKRKLLRFIDNFKFTCASFSRANRSSFRIKYDDDGFNYFKEVIKIRDRLMHPKSKSDLHISDEETKSARKAWDWYQQQFAEMLGDCMSSFEAYAKTLKDKAKTK